MDRRRCKRHFRPSYTDGVARYISRKLNRSEPKSYPPKGILHTEFPLNFKSSFSLLTYFCVQSNFEPRIELRKYNSRSVLLNIDEWKKLMSNAATIDQHLQQSDNFTGYPSSIPIGRFEAVFMYSHNVPELCIRARDDAPMNVDGIFQCVKITPHLWLKIKAVSPIVNNFTSYAEQHQTYASEILHHLKFLHETTENEKNTELCALGRQRNIIQSCVEQMLAEEDFHKNGFNSSFNIIRFCYELVVYYPYII